MPSRREIEGPSARFTLAEKQDQVARRIHDMAHALDDGLAAQGYTLRGPDGHVNLFDGEIDMTTLSEEIINKLRTLRWELVKT